MSFKMIISERTERYISGEQKQIQYIRRRGGEDEDQRIAKDIPSSPDKKKDQNDGEKAEN